MYPSRRERVNSKTQHVADMSEQQKTNETRSAGSLPSAFDRLEHWIVAWKRTGTFILLLDFDGTLAPIVERPEMAGISESTRAAIVRLIDDGVTVAIVSGRGLADARSLAGLPDIAYAGNHGMEIEMPGLERIHPEAAAARGSLEQVAAAVPEALNDVSGLFVEDKGLTLSIHYRRVDRAAVERVREAVHEAAGRHPDLRVTEGKEVLEVRPDVDWHKGRAVEFLLGELKPPKGAPVLYIGDDRTDEDAFVALADGGFGEGILVSEDGDTRTSARSTLKNPEEVGRLLDLLHRRGTE